MGWYEDNVSGPQDDALDAMSEMMGYGKFYRDPAQAGGYKTPKQVAYPESEFDESKWKKKPKASGTVKKTSAKTTYLLTDGDLLSLQYERVPNSQGYRVQKDYKKQEVLEMAWRKYGGPAGLAAARVATRGAKAERREKKAEKAASSPVASSSKSSPIKATDDDEEDYSPSSPSKSKAKSPKKRAYRPY